jgi:hypothetical protein
MLRGRKAWFALKRWLWKIGQGPERSHLERELRKERLNERFAYTREQGYELGSFLINKTNIKDISEIKYPMLTLTQY